MGQQAEDEGEIPHGSSSCPHAPPAILWHLPGYFDTGGCGM
jgi:hypothetical protein